MNENNMQPIISNVNQGIQGLGNINTDHENNVLSSPYSYLSKNDTDNRKIAMDSSRFGDTQSLEQYMLDWFSNTGVVMAQMCSDEEAHMTNGVKYIKVQMQSQNMMSEMFNVFCALDNKRAVELVHMIMSMGQNMMGCIRVIFGYFNASIPEIKGIVKNTGIDTFGMEDILDVNTAIDSADKKMPYIGMSNVKLSVKLAKMLNGKYSSMATGSPVSNMFGGEALRTDSNNLGGAFQDGINQLKNSVTGMLAGLGINKNLGGGKIGQMLGTGQSNQMQNHQFNNMQQQMNPNMQMAQPQFDNSAMIQNQQQQMQMAQPQFDNSVMIQNQQVINQQQQMQMAQPQIDNSVMIQNQQQMNMQMTPSQFDNSNPIMNEQINMNQKQTDVNVIEQGSAGISLQKENIQQDVSSMIGQGSSNEGISLQKTCIDPNIESNTDEQNNSAISLKKNPI